jgi:ATP-dependent DNA ligase
MARKAGQLISRGSRTWLVRVSLGWTEDAHLRHSQFVSLREDKRAGDVRRE